MCWFLFLEGPSLELEAEPSADWKNQRKPQKTCATGQTSSASLPLLSPAHAWLRLPCILLLLYPKCGSWNFFSLAFFFFLAFGPPPGA